MASNKECTVIILDVGRNAGSSTKAGTNCTVEIMKEKICTGKKDFISFVLLGAERTQNNLNDTVDTDGYLHIVQYPHVITPSWELLVEFLDFVTEPKAKSSQGEWLDAIVVAMEIIKSNAEIHKFVHRKIILFHDFNSDEQDYGLFDVITNNLKELHIQLIVVSNNIQYIDDYEGCTQVIFRNRPDRSNQQSTNEEYALRLASACNAILCNYHEALYSILRVETLRPWTWNSELPIGSRIKIQISAVIAIKDEIFINLKKRVAASGEITQNVKKFFCGADEIHPTGDDLIEGYMLGATPMPYDPSLGQKSEPTVKGLKFIAFVKCASIPDEYFCGLSTYWIVHRQKMQSSARMLDALVKALLATDMAILAWKVYNNGNTPKITVLLPNKINDKQCRRPASLSLLEMSYQSQHRFWDFPRLRTRKTELTDGQLDAIDKLIDAMDLTASQDSAKEKPRETRDKDLLPFERLPDIADQNLMNYIEKHILETCSADQVAANSLNKDWSERNFWKIPSLIEPQASEAAKVVKGLFPLEKSLQTTKEKLFKHFGASIQTACDDSHLTSSQEESLKIHRVGTITPAEDFETLIQKVVIKIQDTTMRDAKFQLFAYEMRTVLWDLLFKSLIEQHDKVAAGLKTYRGHALDFNPYDYNDWIVEMKVKIIERQMFEFWDNVIVKEKLGLCFGSIIVKDSEAEEAFYKMDKNATASNTAIGNGEDNLNDESVEDLLANM